MVRWNAPTAGGGAASTIDVGAVSGDATSAAFDSQGNLYVPALNPVGGMGTVWEFPIATTPFSSTMAANPVVKISGFSNTAAVAVGPP